MNGTEVQTQQTAAPANSAEGQPTPVTPPVTAAEAPQGATVDNATIQTTPQESAPPNQAAAGDQGTGLDVGQLTRSDYADQVQAIIDGKVKIKEEPAGEAAGTPEGTQPGAGDADLDDDDDAPAAPGKGPAMKVPLPADPQAANLQSEALRILRSNIRAGTPISLSEAERRAKVSLGIADDPAPAAAAAATGTPPAQAEPPAATERTLAQIEEEIRSTRAEKQQKNKEFDFDSDVELLEKLDALAEEKRSLQTQQAQREQSVASQWAASKQQVVQLYPDATNPDSALNIIAAHIDQQWTQSGDARLNKPDAPLLVYQEAARRLNVQPAKVAAPAAAAASVQSPTSQPVQRPPAAAVLAGGGAGTTAHTAAGPDFGEITSPADYMAAVTKVTGASYAPTKRV